MGTILLRLSGAMQSWGTASRFDERDTLTEPSKSGVVGIVAASLGVGRDNWHSLAPLAKLSFGVRCDRRGLLRRDFQTAKDAVRADGKPNTDPVVSSRYYLADATFLVGLSGADEDLLRRIDGGLRNPVWPLFLGRKSYVPSESIWLPDGLRRENLREALLRYSPLCRLEDKTVLFSWESPDGAGSMRMDQPISSFNDRQFGARFVVTEPLSLAEEPHVVA